jgi:hypothetical protein
MPGNAGSFEVVGLDAARAEIAVIMIKTAAARENRFI